MSGLDDMLAAHAGGADISDVDSLLAHQAGSVATPAKPAPASLAKGPGPSKGERVVHGLGDTEFGLGQLAEHVPVLNTVVSGWRQLIQQGLKTAGFDHASELFNQSEDGGLTDQKAAAQFDGIVQTREKDYQDARAAAGQTGIDWWRLGGNAANPINYLGPGGAATSAMRRIGQGALQGGLASAEQPTDTPGSFWWDKAKGMATGAVAGGAASSVIEAASPVLKAGIALAKKYLGKGVADTAAAESVVNDALRAKGVDPATVDLNVLAAMKQEVNEALKAGADDISPTAIANRAKAESLPIPMKLTRGMATGDARQLTDEYNNMGVKGVGEPLIQRQQELNQAAIDNLDALGAKNAPSVIDAGNKMQQLVQGHWDQLQEQKTQLYDAVKNSQGLSAKVDGQSAGQEIRETLGAPEAFHAWSELPKSVQDTIHDMEGDRLPLTASMVMALDKKWGQLAAANPEASHAINQARQILGKAEISDGVGQDAMKAYQAAKQAHAQQMSLLEPKLLNGRPNPNYQPLVKAVVVDGKPPEGLFQSHFMGAAPSVAKKNMDFLATLDPNAEMALGKTFMGEIKNQVAGVGQNERASISQAKLTNLVYSPVNSERLNQLLPAPQVQTLRNLADTVENMKKFPVGSSPNRSGTGSAVINAVSSAVKSNAGAQILKRIPGIKGGIVEPIAEGVSAAKTAAQMHAALKPGVTLKSLLSGTPRQAAGKRALSRLVTPTAVAAYAADNQVPTPPE